VLPDVWELEFVEVVAGLRPATPDNRPLIGRAGERVIHATGHYRNGILLAPLTADRVLGELTRVLA
jgi:glycine oxidase